MLIITKNRHFNILSVILNHLPVIFLLTELLSVKIESKITDRKIYL
ncbi:hypothetical protein OBG91_03725 [Lactococcus lactis]|nr:hypothetical protein [Lactococcus lactis]